MIQLNRIAAVLLVVLALVILSCSILAIPNNKRETVLLSKTVTVAAGQAATIHNATLAWTAPTKCVDGTTCSVIGYNVYKATIACPATGLPTGAIKIASAITATTFTDTPLVPGVYCYYVTAIGGAGSNGAESAASNATQGVLAQPAMSAPTNFTVIVN